jgi:HAD superfamily hydrolase (TIGR01549 family)
MPRLRVFSWQEGSSLHIEDKQRLMHKRSWAVILDLDETLVLTSAIQALRSRRVWPEVYAAFNKTRLPSGTLEFLKRINEVAQLGLVTKAPRPYAEKLLAHHDLRIPVLAAYHDVARIKPHPEGLLLASQKLGVPPARCIYIGDDANDVQAAKAAGMTALGICWGKEIEIGLSTVCKSWDELYVEITRLIQR